MKANLTSFEIIRLRLQVITEIQQFVRLMRFGCLMLELSIFKLVPKLRKQNYAAKVEMIGRYGKKRDQPNKIIVAVIKLNPTDNYLEKYDI